MSKNKQNESNNIIFLKKTNVFLSFKVLILVSYLHESKILLRIPYCCYFTKLIFKVCYE